MRPITVSVAPPATESSWVRFDDWAFPQVSVQCNPSGGANYTVQQTLDDPNSPTNPVAVGSVTWLNSPAANLVGATTAQQATLNSAPIFAKVVLNNATGSVTATFVQFSNNPA